MICPKMQKSSSGCNLQTVAQQVPLSKLSDNNSGANIGIQIYTADIKELIFALNISLRQTSL